MPETRPEGRRSRRTGSRRRSRTRRTSSAGCIGVGKSLSPRKARRILLVAVVDVLSVFCQLTTGKPPTCSSLTFSSISSPSPFSSPPTRHGRRLPPSSKRRHAPALLLYAASSSSRSVRQRQKWAAHQETEPEGAPAAKGAALPLPLPLFSIIFYPCRGARPLRGGLAVVGGLTTEPFSLALILNWVL